MLFLLSPQSFRIRLHTKSINHIISQSFSWKLYLEKLIIMLTKYVSIAFEYIFAYSQNIFISFWYNIKLIVQILGRKT